MLEIRPILTALLHHKSATLLIIFQIALTLAVISNASLIINDRLSMMNRDSGIDEKNVFVINRAYIGDRDNISQLTEEDEIMIRNIAGVADALSVNSYPMAQGGWGGGISNELNDDSTEHVRSFHATLYMGDEHYLNTYQLKLLQGRFYTADEVMTEYKGYFPSIAVITKSLADKLFPQGDALGQTIYDGDHPVEVIGIVAKHPKPWVHNYGFEDSVIYPSQTDVNWRFVIRTEPGMQEQVMQVIEEKLLALDDQRVIFDKKTFTTVRKEAYQNDINMTKLLYIVIILLASITALGIIGMATFSVQQRTKQIGTRRALGASKMDIIKYFLLENWLIASIGVTLGIALSIIFNHYLVEQFSLPKIEWLYIVASTVFIWLLGQLAVAIPAKVASEISPAIATRTI